MSNTVTIKTIESTHFMTSLEIAMETAHVAVSQQPARIQMNRSMWQLIQVKCNQDRVFVNINRPPSVAEPGSMRLRVLAIRDLANARRTLTIKPLFSVAYYEFTNSTDISIKYL